jgi:hypothetical protein
MNTAGWMREQTQLYRCIMAEMETPSRRRLLQIMLAAQGAQLACAQRHPFKSFSSSDAVEIETLASQIIPSTGSPGAREANVIYFIDQALATFDAQKRDVYSKGLASIQEKRRELFPDSQSIATLTAEQQISLVGAIEKTQFFETLRTHTVMGFLAKRHRSVITTARKTGEFRDFPPCRQG